MPTHRIDQKLSRIVYDLDDKDIVAEVARTGEMEVVVGWDEERFNPSVADPAEYQDRVSYFMKSFELGYPFLWKGRKSSVCRRQA